MLSWNFEVDLPTTIRKYQVYAYQEGAPVEVCKTEMWKKVGDVDALPLPMACTLTQVNTALNTKFTSTLEKH